MEDEVIRAILSLSALPAKADKLPQYESTFSFEAGSIFEGSFFGDG
jgi:hypothetical protein